MNRVTKSSQERAWERQGGGQNYRMTAWWRRGGFSLTEMLVVLAVIAILTGITVGATVGFRPPGMQRSAMAQLLATLEEARMGAIEKGVQTYVGFAGPTDGEEERRLRGYIVFRELTQAEREALPPQTPTNTVIAVTRWETLPRGFYYDEAETTVLGDAAARISVQGLPGGVGEVQAIGFGRLGQVVLPASESPRVVVMEGRRDPATGHVTPLPGGDSSSFTISVARLTGRATLQQR